MSVEVGEEAPVFVPPSENRGSGISTENRTREGPRVLFGRVCDRSSVRTDRMEDRLQAEIERFEEQGARVPAVGVDEPSSHEASAEDRGGESPPLSNSRRDVIEEHGVEQEGGFPGRVHFVIDREGAARTKTEPSPKDRTQVGEVLDDLQKAL